MQLDEGEFIFIYRHRVFSLKTLISQPINEINAYEALKKFRKMNDVGDYKIEHVAKLKDDELRDYFNKSHHELSQVVYP